ncbi:MAG: transposase [Blastococcus sp.]|nr:transposase [Blastococcus sp.]
MAGRPGTTGEPIRRYGWTGPASWVHVDVKKLAHVPDGGWRAHSREQGGRNRQAHRDPG